MLRIVIEIVPGGIGKPRELAQAVLGNISDFADRSDYAIRAREVANTLAGAPAWGSRGRILGHDRNQTGLAAGRAGRQVGRRRGRRGAAAMNTEYGDIPSRIAEPPKWWDEFAVPRYCEFAPKHAAHPRMGGGADCHRMPSVPDAVPGRHDGRPWPDAAAIKDRSLHYGDPPNIRCCEAGPSMNCVDLRVLEFWGHLTPWAWERDPSLGTDLEGRG